MTTLIAIDPGETIGVAVFQDGECTGGFVAFDVRGINGIFKAYPPSVVVVEEFNRQHGASGPQVHTIKLIGAIELLASQCDATYVTQANAVKKGYESLAAVHPMIQALPGMHRRHVKDAMAHGLFYLAKQRMS